MNFLHILFAVFVFVIPPAMGAEVGGTLDVTFTAESTLHRFEGHANGIPYVARSPADRDQWSAEIVLPVESLTTENRLRDHNMRAMFDVENYPRIVAALRDVRPDGDSRQAGKLDAIEFQLTIDGVTRHVRAAISDWHRAGGEVRFDASFTVSLHEFGLVPPSVLFVKVADTVAVVVHVRGVDR